MSHNSKITQIEVIDLLHTDEELEQMAEAIRETEALNEVNNLFSEINARMHRILDIEQNQGFLTDAQHNKIFDDANDYDDMRTDVVQRNTPKPTDNKSSKPTPLITFNNDTDDDLYGKAIIRKRAKDFLAELF